MTNEYVEAEFQAELGFNYSLWRGLIFCNIFTMCESFPQLYRWVILASSGQAPAPAFAGLSWAFFPIPTTHMPGKV